MRRSRGKRRVEIVDLAAKDRLDPAEDVLGRQSFQRQCVGPELIDIGSTAAKALKDQVYGVIDLLGRGGLPLGSGFR